MAKLIRCLVPGVSRGWGETPNSVPGESPFHQKRAQGRRWVHPSSRRTLKVVLASEMRKMTEGKRCTARRRRKIVKKLMESLA